MTVEPANKIAEWADRELESQILNAVSLDVPWRLVEDFSSLVRLSGSPEERRAFELLVRQLSDWGVPHTLHEPETFISIPGPASVRSLADNTTFHARP